MARYNYETIKTLAKDIGCKITDLIALAPQNDPFYTGTTGDIDKAQWFAGIWQKAGYSNGVHLRRVHYWCVSQDGLTMHDGQPYQNTDKCWKYLTQCSKMARYLGLVDIADVADHKNPDPVINARFWLDNDPEYEINIPELSDPEIDIYGIYEDYAQPYHLEVWCEKSTMNDVLEPVCRRYGANLATFEGEVSITACYQLIRRIEAGNKPVRIFYISDFDPAGNSMPVATARKVEYMLNKYGLTNDVKLKPVVLTAEQVTTYRLPRTPIKESEKRAASFENAFGTGAVELDALEALHPGQLAQIVTRAVSPYYDYGIAQEVNEQAEALRQAISQQVQAIVSRYQPQIEALQAMQDELRAIEMDASEYAVERAEAMDIEPVDGWLFDSTRAYVDQIGYYKAHKGQDSAIDAA